MGKKFQICFNVHISIWLFGMLQVAQLSRVPIRGFNWAEICNAKCFRFHLKGNKKIIVIQSLLKIGFFLLLPLNNYLVLTVLKASICLLFSAQDTSSSSNFHGPVISTPLKEKLSRSSVSLSLTSEEETPMKEIEQLDDAVQGDSSYLDALCEMNDLNDSAFHSLSTSS